MNMTLIAAILGVCVALDHVLILIPSIKANNTYQLIHNALVMVGNLVNQALGSLNPPAPPAP